MEGKGNFMSRKLVVSKYPSFAARGLTVALMIVVAASAFVFSLTRTDSALAHCDSVNGPVVTAAKAALEANDVGLILPYVKADDEAELTTAFEQAMSARALGGDAQVVADRYFFETAVRLHRSGEGAPYTGLKEAGELDPALEAAEGALESGALTDVYGALDQSIQAGVETRYQAMIEAREREASEGTVEASRARVEAELEFETYIHGISLAAGAPGEHQVEESHGAGTSGTAQQ
jgi:hypothetical protein